MTGLWNRLRDKLRDHTREDLCDLLNSMGVPAKLAEPRRPEEIITTERGESLGLIELGGSPIRWVVVKRDIQNDRPLVYFEYGVPDEKFNTYFGKARLMATELRASPLFGNVIAMKWVGSAPGSLAERLEADEAGMRLMLDNGGCTVEAHQSAGCWIMTTHRSPTAPVFRAYLKVAEQLLVPV
jgi:hypothetical protein